MANACEDSTGPRKRFRVKDMFYRESLPDLLEKRSRFRIVEHHCENYALLDIVSTEESNEDDLFRLAECICEHVEDPASQFIKSPKKLDIVLARKEDGKVYHRCIISSFMENDKKYANVFWIDAGGTGTVEVASLKPVSKEIMEYPRLAYSVILEGVPSTSNFILFDEFNEKMCKLYKSEFTVELGAPSEMGGLLYCKNQVKLKLTSNKSVDLGEHIKSLKKWEWENWSNLIGSDGDICQNGLWGTKSQEHRHVFMSKLPVPYKLTSLAVKPEFSATVSRVLSDVGEDNRVGPTRLRLILLDDKLYFNYFNVMHHQMARYAENITPKRYFPALDEPFMFKLGKNKEYRKYAKCIGRWVRAQRLLNDSFYVFDFDDMIRFSDLPESDYEMRPLYGEFYKVPLLCLTVQPTDGDGMLSLERAQEQLKPRKRYQFTVVKELDYIYEVNFAPVKDEESEKKFTMSYFFSTVNE